MPISLEFKTNTPLRGLENLPKEITEPSTVQKPPLDLKIIESLHKANGAVEKLIILAEKRQYRGVFQRASDWIWGIKEPEKIQLETAKKDLQEAKTHLLKAEQTTDFQELKLELEQARTFEKKAYLEVEGFHANYSNYQMSSLDIGESFYFGVDALAGTLFAVGTGGLAIKLIRFAMLYPASSSLALAGIFIAHVLASAWGVLAVGTSVNLICNLVLGEPHPIKGVSVDKQTGGMHRLETKSESPKKGGVFFVINTTEEDYSGVGNPYYTELILENRLAEFVFDSFPKTTIIPVRGNTNREIHDQLKIIMELDKYSGVDGLLTISHGSGGQLPEQEDKPLESHLKSYYSHIDNESEKFSVDLEDADEVEIVFGPIVDRFNPHAKIIINGCNTIKGGITPLINRKRMRKVALHFGLQDGSLYMNETLALDIGLLVRTPLFAPKKHLLSYPMHASHIFLSIPFYLIEKLFHHNEGYTLVVDKNQSAIYKDGYSHAVTHADPAGVLLNSGSPINMKDGE